MSCTLDDLEVITWVRGSVDYLRAPITDSDGDLIADGTPVAFTFDRETYHAGEWIGVAAATRTCRVLISDTELPTYSAVDVFVRFTDNPEIPLIPVGRLNVI